MGRGVFRSAMKLHLHKCIMRFVSVTAEFPVPTACVFNTFADVVPLRIL